MALVSVRIPDTLVLELKDLAAATGRSKNYLAQTAIQEFVDRETWQVAAIKQAITEADAGDFATEEEIAALDAKWGAK